jgi:hypothetical protein
VSAPLLLLLLLLPLLLLLWLLMVGAQQTMCQVPNLQHRQP